MKIRARLASDYYTNTFTNPSAFVGLGNKFYVMRLFQHARWEESKTFKRSNVIPHRQNPTEQCLTENLNAQLVENVSASYLSYCYSQQFVTGSDPEPQESISFFHSLFLNTWA
jgi:hypothetical protein